MPIVLLCVESVVSMSTASERLSLSSVPKPSSMNIESIVIPPAIEEILSESPSASARDAFEAFTAGQSIYGTAFPREVIEYVERKRVLRFLPGIL